MCVSMLYLVSTGSNVALTKVRDRICGDVMCRFLLLVTWGIGSVGRAFALQARGHRFESDILHSYCF